MNSISILKNPVQDYAWGSRTAIQALTGKSVPGETPMAELWMGAHPKAPSLVRTRGEWKSLKDEIETSPEPVLGKRVAREFSGKLPFLFKVLAAEKPLSIQVHPNLAQALSGFERENGLGIPLTAPNRNYRDGNHKPETLCAVSPFQALKGFRDIEEILSLVDKVSPVSLSDELARLRSAPDTGALKGFFTGLMTMDRARQERVVKEAVDLAEKHMPENRAFYWMVELNREFPGDVGVLAPLVLNVIELEPGEALFISAGELHAYLYGVGIELMANSDNVLRGGLTPKHVDVAELLKIVDFRSGPALPHQPETAETCERIYPVHAREFFLSVIHVDKGQAFLSPHHRNVEILICMEGEADIRDLENNEAVPLTRGESVIVPAAAPHYRIDGSATLYKASVP